MFNNTDQTKEFLDSLSPEELKALKKMLAKKEPKKVDVPRSMRFRKPADKVMDLTYGFLGIKNNDRYYTYKAIGAVEKMTSKIIDGVKRKMGK